MYINYNLFLESIVSIDSMICEKTIDYENGFTLSYKIVNNDLKPICLPTMNILYFTFKKNNTSFYYFKSFDVMTKYNRGGQSDATRTTFLNENTLIFKTEKEIEEFSDFDKLYTFSPLSQHLILDHNLKPISSYMVIIDVDGFSDKILDILKESPYVINCASKRINVLLPQDIFDKLLKPEYLKNAYDLTNNKIGVKWVSSELSYTNDFKNDIIQYIIDHSKKYNILY